MAPTGGATFGVGVALKNVTGKPLTITGVDAINGFIRLIGIHFRAYTPPVGSCTHWAQTIYDRTVEVTYTQTSRVVQIQEVPTVPLTITRRGAC